MSQNIRIFETLPQGKPRFFPNADTTNEGVRIEPKNPDFWNYAYGKTQIFPNTDITNEVICIKSKNPGFETLPLEKSGLFLNADALNENFLDLQSCTQNTPSLA